MQLQREHAHRQVRRLPAHKMQLQVELAPPGVRFHALGPVPIRGKALVHNLYRIEWQEDTSTDMMTMPGFSLDAAAGPRTAPQGRIELRYLDQVRDFGTAQLPVHLGRAREAEFVVQDSSR